MTAALSQLLPPSIISVGGPVADWQGGLLPAEEACVVTAVEKRQREFIAGRTQARELLSSMGVQDFPLIPDDQRCPLWPMGIVGSITHTNDYCAVAIGRTSTVKSIGLDIEQVGRVTNELWPKIFVPQEIEWLSTQPEKKRSLLSSIMFSAKEAFYKFQYPNTKEWLGFADVEIYPTQDHSLLIKVRGSPVHSGRYTEFDGHVITAFYILINRE